MVKKLHSPRYNLLKFTAFAPLISFAVGQIHNLAYSPFGESSMFTTRYPAIATFTFWPLVITTIVWLNINFIRRYKLLPSSKFKKLFIALWICVLFIIIMYFFIAAVLSQYFG